MKKYFVTDNERLGLQASLVIHALYSGDYFKRAKEHVKDAEFVRVNELYNILSDGDGADTEIILSKFSKPWENSLKIKYPKARIELYKEPDVLKK
ncbi:hypothetical protein OfM1_11960 [Lactovum odontotermitis]